MKDTLQPTALWLTFPPAGTNPGGAAGADAGPPANVHIVAALFSWLVVTDTSSPPGRQRTCPGSVARRLRERRGDRRLQRRADPGRHGKAGYRCLEGGADNNEVYTFALVRYLAAGVVVRF
jgi:hypothetical protein